MTGAAADGGEIAGASDEEDRQRQADAYRRALGLLVRREQSRRDLKRKLKVRGVDAEHADAAVERLAGQGFQDDARFAASFARDRAAAGYGPVRIRHELAGHGLTSDGCEAALAACEGDWGARATRLVERRATADALDDPERRRKLYEFLVRRGFGPDDARAAIAARRRGGDAD
jgi:regulatory protein